MPSNQVLRRQWRDQEQWCARNASLAGTGWAYFLAREEYQSVEGQIQKIIQIYGSWWEGKLRLPHRKAVHALPGFEPFSPHLHSFLLPSMQQISFYRWLHQKTTPGVKLLRQHHCGTCPQISIFKHFLSHQVKKLLFLQTQLHFATGKNVNLLEFS